MYEQSLEILQDMRNRGILSSADKRTVEQLSLEISKSDQPH